MAVIDAEAWEALVRGARTRPLVVVTVGSDHHRFDRLVAGVDAWAADHDADVLVQYGTATPPVHAHGLDFCSHAALLEALAAADVVVVQGGPMSIVESRRAGRKPIVMPRLGALDEVVDDHQVTFCELLADRDMLVLAPDVATLHAELDVALAAGGSPRVADDGDPVEVALARDRFRRVVEGVVRRPAADRPRVLLLGGAGRSGSTLLERLLGEVPDVQVLGETVHLWERGLRDDELCGCGEPFSRCPFWQEVGQRAFGGWDRLDPDEAVELRRSVVRSRYAPGLLGPGPVPSWRLRRDRLARRVAALHAAAAAVSGATLLVDSSKHPAYAMLLRRAALDLRCVLVVRDPRAVAHSWQRVVRRPEIVDREVEMPRYGLAQTAFTWEAYSLLFSLLRRLGVPVMTVRYEDLMGDPTATLRDILDFAGLGGATLPTLAEGRVELTASHTVAGNPMRFQVGEVEVRLDERWREEMSEPDARTVARLTGWGRRRHDYR